MRRRRFFTVRGGQWLGVATLTTGLLLSAPLPSPGAGEAESQRAIQASNDATDLRSNATTAAVTRPDEKKPDAPGTKSKARLLAAGGLVVCSLLVLATGIALLRVLRQR